MSFAGMPFFFRIFTLFASAACAALISIHPACADDAELLRKTRALDEQTQALKREVLELGRNLAYLAWVGGVKPVGDPAQARNQTFNLKALRDDTVHMGHTLALLEDGVLAPPGIQLVVFTSLDAGPDFALQEITLKLDDKIVMRRKYTPEENTALRGGGAHRVYIGDLREGAHRLTAFAISAIGDGKPRQESITFDLTKGRDRKTLELRISSFFTGARINVKEWD
jgi:hypothetical protein